MYCLEAVLKYHRGLSSFEECINDKGEKLLVNKYASFEAAYIWELLSTTHPGFYNEEVLEEIFSTTLKYSNSKDVLKRNRATNFRVALNSGSLEYTGNPDFWFSRLDIKNLIIDEKDAETWIRPLIEEGLLTQARIYNWDYDFWQNAYDPLQFEANNRSINDLPMKSNGLPFPLDQQIIDISNNPGRWELKQGYIEAVGSVMWLSDYFFEKTGVNKAYVLSVDWLTTESIGDFVKLTAANKPFSTDEGQTGELQKKLRSLLYNFMAC